MQPRRNVNEIATGRWPNILAHFGVAEKFLTGKHGPCPICGGKDRFRFDNKEGARHVDLLAVMRRWRWLPTARTAERLVFP